MSLIDRLFNRESVQIRRDSKIILAGETDRVLVCYKCDRELGPDHDNERCARRGMSRRFFMGGLAIGAATAAATAAASAAEAGLFGEKQREIVAAVKNLSPLPVLVEGGILLNQGDSIAFDVPSVLLGYDTGFHRGVLARVSSVEGKMTALRPMRVHSMFAMNGDRLPLKVIRKVDLT